MKIQEWARRHQAQALRPADLTVFRDPSAEARTGLPPAWVDGIRSFYDQLHGGAAPLPCTGTACHFARPSARAARPEPAPSEGAHCYGRCYEAPVTGPEPAAPIPRASLAPTPVVLRHLLGDPASQPGLTLPRMYAAAHVRSRTRQGARRHVHPG
jgi:hypothetical protein